jgi:organic radical activating enzyme
MKIFPIRVEKLIPSDYKFIEWTIHNVCNYDCSFCDDKTKNGSKRWKTIEQYKTYADKIIKLCEGKPFWIHITGGEPTLYPDLLELLEYIKSKGGYIHLNSNGSRTLRWWEELKEKKCLDYLTITCHPDQIDSCDNIIKVLNLFHDEPVTTICMITHTINSFDKGVVMKKSIEENTGAIIIFKGMLIDDYDIYALYNEDQHTQVMKPTTHGIKYDSKAKYNYPKNHKITDSLKVTYSDDSIKLSNTQMLLKTKQNDFFNYKCTVGIDTMRIEVDKIFRGVCGVGGVQYHLDDDFKFSDDYIICDTHKCRCGIDLVTTKIK